MDIIEALEKHHEGMRRLLEKVENDSTLFMNLKDHLMVHHRTERDLLFEGLAGKKQTRPDALELIEEHRIIEIMLLGLDGYPSDDDGWAVKLRVLSEYVKRHFGKEEEEVFKQAREMIGEDERKELGRKYEETRNACIGCS